jgi:hypothetical protein
MQSAIDQKISLSGDAAVKQQLAAVGAAGERAGKQISEAGAGASNGLAKISSAVGGLSGHFNAAGQELAPFLNLVGNLGSNFESLTSKILSFTGVVGPFTAAVGLAAVGLLKLSKDSADATRTVGNEAVALGITREKLEGLVYAGGQVGLSHEALITGAERLLRSFGQYAQVQQTVTDNYQKSDNAAEKFRISQNKAALAVDESRMAVDRGSAAAGQASRAIVDQEISVRKLGESHRLLEQAQKAGFATIEATKAGQLKMAESSLALSDAQAKLTGAGQRYNESLQEQNILLTRARIAEDDRRLAQNQTKAADPLATNPYAQMGIAAKDAQGQVKDFNAILTEVQEKFSTTFPSAAEQARAAMQIFGRGFAQYLPLLRLGSDGLAKLQEEFAKSGAGATDAEVKYAAAFEASWNRLSSIIEGLKTAFGNIAGQIFVPIFDAISQGLSKNAQGIRDLGDMLVALVKPAAQAIIGVLSPAFSALAAIVEELRTDLSWTFGTQFTAGATVALVLIARFAPIFGTILLAADLLRRAVNGIFGTEFTTSQFVVVGLLLRMGPLILLAVAGFLRFGPAVGMVTKAFAALRNVIEFAGIAMGAFDAAAAPWIALGVVIALVGAALLLVATNASTVSDFIRQYIGGDAADIFDHFVELVQEKFAAAVDALEAGIAGWAKFFADKIDDALAWLEKLEQKLLYIATLGIAGGSGASAAASDPGSAGAAVVGATGGHIRGPGSGTSDSILARVSNGEFIVNAQAVMRTGLGALHAINRGGYRMGGLVRDALNPLPAFAMGGMAGSIGGGGNGGGSSSGGAPVHLHIGGEEHVMHTDRATADAIVRVARSSDMARTGNKPSWSR